VDTLPLLVVESRSRGVQACLTKPARREELYSVLTGAIGRHEGERARVADRDELASQGHGRRVLLAEDNLVNQCGAS
jgi:hypothetical protein